MFRVCKINAQKTTRVFFSLRDSETLRETERKRETTQQKERGAKVSLLPFFVSLSLSLPCCPPKTTTVAYLECCDDAYFFIQSKESIGTSRFDDDDVSPTLCFGVVDDGKSGGRKHAFGGRHAWWYDVFIVQQRCTQRRRRC